MNIEELTIKIIATVIPSVIALIVYLFKGKFADLFSKFVNFKQGFFTALFGMSSIIAFVLIFSFFIAYLDVIKLVKVAVIFLYSIVLILFIRFLVIGTGKYSFTFQEGILTERANWIKFFGNPEFICNINGIDVAFYSTDRPFFNIVYVPVDIDNLNMYKWIEIDEKIRKLIFHVKSIDKLKSALDCS